MEHEEAGRRVVYHHAHLAGRDGGADAGPDPLRPALSPRTVSRGAESIKVSFFYAAGLNWEWNECKKKVRISDLFLFFAHYTKNAATSYT